MGFKKIELTNCPLRNFIIKEQFLRSAHCDSCVEWRTLTFTLDIEKVLNKNHIFICLYLVNSDFFSYSKRPTSSNINTFTFNIITILHKHCLINDQ